MIAAARQIADAFKQTYESEQPLDEIIALMDKLVKDEEQTVRMVVMEQILEIALFCQQIGESLQYVIEKEIIPHVITLLPDEYAQVRKVAQTGVITLVERGVMSTAVVEESVFPVILKLAEVYTQDDHRPDTEVITFMCKMAPLVGKKAIVNSYLSSFCFSCEDTGFQVRRICAMGMADMAPVIGPVLTEKALLPRFLTLCDDEVWGVRKCCAEVFTVVARVCSYNVRKKCLAQAFINLLEDQSRWVRLTAFPFLGQLIATFVHEEGDDVVPVADDLEQRFLLDMKETATILMEKRNEKLLEFMEKRNQELLELDARNAAEKENGSQQLNGTGNGDGSPTTKDTPGPKRHPDPFDDDEDDWGPYPTRPTDGEKQYSWLLDRSFGPSEPEPNWGSDEDWGEVPMDCSDSSDQINQPSKTPLAEQGAHGFTFDEWGNAVNTIPTEMNSKVEDEEAVVTRDKEKVPEVFEQPTNKKQKSVTGLCSIVGEPMPAPVDWNEEDKTEMSSSVTSSVITAPASNKEKTELDVCLPPSSVSISNSKEEKKDRIQIHVGATSTRNSSSFSNTSSSGNSSHSSTETSSYNTFQYWRLPIPDLELDIDMVNGKATNVHVRAKVFDHSKQATYSSEVNVSIRMDQDESAEKELEETKSNNATVEWTDEDWGYEDLLKNPPTTTTTTNGISSQEIKSSSTEFTEEDDWDSDGHVTVLLESNGENTDGGANAVRTSQDVHRSYYNLHTVSSSPSDANTKSTVIELKYQKKLEPSDRNTDVYADLFGSEKSRSEKLPYIVKAHGPSGDQGRLLPSLQISLTVQDQDVVPPSLLKYYLSMADSNSDNAETELPVYCAYTFPAVVITLGGEHWAILRECFEKLATMFQWKIRYTLGSCLHEIAKVIGPELTERDLLPFYDAITKDIDEVRNGILFHIAKFTRILRGEARFCVLDSLKNFLRADNKNNWRFRHELAVQIEELTGIYEPEDVHRHLCPMALQLAKDPIADVRRSALRVITEQVKKLNEVKNWDERCGGNLLREFILNLVEQFGHSSDKWVQRQSFATLAGQLIVFNALDPMQFAQHILPHLLSLSNDKVPNIRLTVAQTLYSHVIKMEYFADPTNPHYSILMDTLEKLQNDVDCDVRYYSGGIRVSNPKTLKETVSAMLQAHQANIGNASTH